VCPGVDGGGVDGDEAGLTCGSGSNSGGGSRKRLADELSRGRYLSGSVVGDNRTADEPATVAAVDAGAHHKDSADEFHKNRSSLGPQMQPQLQVRSNHFPDAAAAGGSESAEARDMTRDRSGPLRCSLHIAVAKMAARRRMWENCRSLDHRCDGGVGWIGR